MSIAPASGYRRTKSNTIVVRSSMAQEQAPAGYDVQDLKQQVEFCLSDTYLALSKVLQNSITKSAPKAISVPLAVIASVLPTTDAKTPDLLSVIAAMKELQNFEVSDDDIVTYNGRSVPSASRIRESRRKSVVVDKIEPNSTSETIHELLAGCGRIVSVGVCHPRLTASYVKGAFRSKTLHAIVQFATVQEAMHAVETTNFSWRGGPRVTHLMTEFRPPSPLRARNQNIPREAAVASDSSSSDGLTNDGDELAEGRKPHELKPAICREWEANENQPKKTKKNKGKKGRASSESDNKRPEGLKRPDQSAKKPSTRKDYAAWAAATPENRVQPPRFVNSSTAPCAPGAPVIDANRPRMPRGPDGTRGFTMGRGRCLPAPA